MGVLFNDPDVDYDDIYWYFILAGQMHESVGRSFTFISFGKSNQHISCCIYLESLFRKNEGLIFTDKKLEAYSCYVELHRKSKSNTGESLNDPSYRD